MCDDFAYSLSDSPDTILCRKRTTGERHKTRWRTRKSQEDRNQLCVSVTDAYIYTHAHCVVLRSLSVDCRFIVCFSSMPHSANVSLNHLVQCLCMCMNGYWIQCLPSFDYWIASRALYQWTAKPNIILNVIVNTYICTWLSDVVKVVTQVPMIKPFVVHVDLLTCKNNY